MGNESGEWIMHGMKWDNPDCIHSVDEAIKYPEFGIALEEAKHAGVEVLSLKCHVGMDRLEIIGENEP